MSIKRICVYCGSSPGKTPAYTSAAIKLGQLLSDRNIGLVYGGAAVGVMGVVANAVLESGGEAIGVIPKSLAVKEVAHDNLTELHVVASMHERKAMMADLADGFIALPGGWGTLEEIFEVLTWAQLGFHDKPCGLLNVDGYFDHLLSYLDHATTEGFLRAENRRMMLCDDTAAGLVQQFEAYSAPKVEKWIR
jgi:uncharacterized protein (TIGR00730 family)